jgi:hypothetical protein
MRLLFFGTYDAAAHPRVAVLRDGLRAHGHDVHECDEPLGVSTAQRVAMLRNPAGLPGSRAAGGRCGDGPGPTGAGAPPAMRRMPSSSATSATSTCCWPGDSSRTCPSSWTT